MKSKSTGITQQMRKASTKEERQKLLAKARTYKFISPRTMRRLQKEVSK